jgi:hypothetical protein
LINGFDSMNCKFPIILSWCFVVWSNFLPLGPIEMADSALAQAVPNTPPTRQQPAPNQENSEAKDWAARGPGFVICPGDVDYQISRTLGWEGLDETAKAVARAQMLELIIDRNLVASQLRGEKTWLGPSKLRMLVEAERSKCRAAGFELTQFLQEVNISEPFWQFDLEWQTAWPQHLYETFPEDKLESIFDSRKRQFDGTEILVAQILIDNKDSDGLARAEELKRRLDVGELTFESAAEQFSIAPSAKAQGRMGWISRKGPMPENYTVATFELQPGEVSNPLSTIYGVHLIKCLEIKPGTLSFLDALEDVRRAVADAEFQAQRRKARSPGLSIEYSPYFPHFNENGVLQFKE